MARVIVQTTPFDHGGEVNRFTAAVEKVVKPAAM